MTGAIYPLPGEMEERVRRFNIKQRSARQALLLPRALPTLPRMRRIALACLLLALAAPALADDYPVSGRFGISDWSRKGAIDCTGLRVISFFDGNQRTDSNGGVPTFRNRSVRQEGRGLYRVVDEFTTGQISNAQAVYDLRIVDADKIELNLMPG